jgi:hypothetical protein
MATTTIAARYFAPSEYRNLIIHCNSCLKGSYRCICYILLVLVSIDEHDIDSIDGYEKTMPGLHLKPEGEPPECFCGDVCKMQVSGDYYNTLCYNFPNHIHECLNRESNPLISSILSKPKSNFESIQIKFLK